MRAEKIFFLTLLLCATTISKVCTDQKNDREWQEFKHEAQSTVDGFKNWCSRVLGYGSDIIAGKKSVEMLPYRYVFFVSFLGGITGALLIYYLHRATRTVNRYEFFEEGEDTDKVKKKIVRPTTFRDIKNNS